MKDVLIGVVLGVLVGLVVQFALRRPDLFFAPG